jgi:hypothetical protein
VNALQGVGELSSCGVNAEEPILIRMASVAPQPLDWLWPGRIPLGKVSLLVGDPGQGKSLVAMDIAARVSRGLPWPDAPQGPPAPVGAVLLLSADEDLGDTPLVGRGDAGEGPRRRGGVLRGLSGALDVAPACGQAVAPAPCGGVTTLPTLDDSEPECGESPNGAAQTLPTLDDSEPERGESPKREASTLGHTEPLWAGAMLARVCRLDLPRSRGL